MRDIRFRYWDKKNKVMSYSVDGWFLSTHLGKLVNVTTAQSEDADNYVLMQFTGLKDKKGTEIYEGDIFKWTMPKGAGRFCGVSKDTTTTSQIIWDTQEACWMLDGVGQDAGWITCLGDLERNLMGEVIGNIYEHEDLLKK